MQLSLVGSTKIPLKRIPQSSCALCYYSSPLRATPAKQVALVQLSPAKHDPSKATSKSALVYATVLALLAGELLALTHPAPAQGIP